MVNGSKNDPSTMQGFSDIYHSEYDKDASKWKKPVAFDGYMNTKFNEGAFSYSETENIGYYTQCNTESKKKNTCNIFLSQYDDMKKSWGKTMKINIPNDSFSLTQPSISADGKTLYFSANFPGGYGGNDIYKVQKTGDNQWSKPENLGPTINTPGNDVFPYISGDTLLVYSSDGLVGFGSLDLYYSKIKSGVYGTPVNFQQPFNSSADDFGLIFNKPGLLEGYFCSNRQGGVGDDDIYKFTMIPVELSADGYVMLDKAGKKPLKGANVIVKGSNGFEQTSQTDKNGYFLINGLTPNSKYSIRIEKEGFFADSKEFKIDNEKYSKRFNKATGLDFDFSLMELTKDEIAIQNIYYDYDSFVLRAEAKVELNKLVTVLNNSPELVIVINSHTDEQGEEKYNLELSEKRAQAVVDYLVSSGISKNRLSAKGWGKSKPIKVNAKTEEENQMNRRTTFQVTNIDQFKTIEQVKGVEFRLQFGASKSQLGKDDIAKVQKILPSQVVKFSKDSDGYYRYTIGVFTTFEDAIKSQDILMKKNIEVFVVAFSDGEKVSIKEAKKILDKKK